ncbi:MAG: hypothetical protein OEM38_08140 [Gammaproteobacteria bacterium]|nr:hypothetical protein [Gammaproteobacteria bacterium]
MSVIDQAEKENVLIDQEDALTAYLQSLLGGGEVVIPASTKSISPETINPAVDNPLQEKPLAKSPIELEQEIEPTISNELVSEFAQDRVVPTLSGNTPEWASTEIGEIKCLSVVVEGLNVLIPADAIFSIQSATNQLKPSTRMPTWIYELDDDCDGEQDAIQIVNTKKLIFDGVKTRRINSKTRTYVILIDDGSWGMSCDGIGEVINLKNDDVKWRGKNTKRRWLAGTSCAYGAIILDIKKIEIALIRVY